MKKALFLVGVFVAFAGLVSFTVMYRSKTSGASEVPETEPEAAHVYTYLTQKFPLLPLLPRPKKYEVYQDGKLWKKFSDLNEAIDAANEREHSAIRLQGQDKWIWDNYLPFDVFTVGDTYTEFEEFAAAAAYARKQQRAFIYYRKNSSLIWDNATPLPKQINIRVPLILQMPELPRGCEVTSLAMLLSNRLVSVDKMTLAAQVLKDDTPYTTVNGRIFYGNPNVGFVGHMEDFKFNGYGVYHGPIFQLLEEYLPDRALDLTGCEFADLEYFLAMNTPVWVIINATYAPLPESSFITWTTADGPIDITYREHSVLLTGYDETRVYFNDPLGVSDSADKQNFAAAWEQMGRQAVSCTP